MTSCDPSCGGSEAKTPGGCRKCGKQRTCGNGFLEVWQRKHLAADFSDLWQIKGLATGDQRPVTGEDGKSRQLTAYSQQHRGNATSSLSARGGHAESLRIGISGQVGVESSRPMIIHRFKNLSNTHRVFIRY